MIIMYPLILNSPETVWNIKNQDYQQFNIPLYFDDSPEEVTDD